MQTSVNTYYDEDFRQGINKKKGNALCELAIQGHQNEVQDCMGLQGITCHRKMTGREVGGSMEDINMLTGRQVDTKTRKLSGTQQNN